MVASKRGIAVVFLTTLAACASPRPAVVPSPSTLDADRSTLLDVNATLAGLSLRDKAAQLVWPFTLGDYLSTDSPGWRRLERLVTEEHVGGFIVSVGSPLDIAVKINALQRASRLPLLISADFEAGAGFRVRAGYFLPNAIDLGGATVFPQQMALGAIGDTALAYEMGRVTALEGRALGVHLSYGPVLDVNNNPANPVIGARAFGEDPMLAARLGASFVRGVQEHGMLATGKHFPGHGDTETNSHLSLSTVNASRARLDSVELVPFRAAIRAGVGAIMTYHGILPALDSSGVPATLSPAVLTGLLRDSMEFKGLLVTDAMDMAGVLKQFGPAESAKRAIVAGADILLMPADVPGMIDAVVAGVREGRYDERRLDASVRRVLELKRRFALDRHRLADLDSVRRIVGDTANATVARTIAERSIVLVKDSLRAVPIRAARGRVLSITYARRTELGAGVAFNAELRRRFPSLRQEYVSADDPAPGYARILAAADSVDATIVASYVNITSESATAGAPRAFVEFVHALDSRDARPLVISFGTPYLLQQIPAVPAYMIAWGPSLVSQQAAARALLGSIPITARLPIRIPPLAAMGAGERRAAVDAPSP